MKRTVLIVLSICILTLIFADQTIAQEESNDTTGYVVVDHKSDNFKTLLNQDIQHGFYLSFDMGVGEINNTELIELGGRLGWIINHGLTIGFAGQGFINNVDTDYNTLDDPDLTGGYGGILIEPIVKPMSPVHVSFPVILGAGGIHKGGYDYGDNYWEDEWKSNTDAFFIARPGVELEANVARFMRIAVGGYYRWAVDVDLEDYDSDVLNGFSGGISLKIGLF